MYRTWVDHWLTFHGLIAMPGSAVYAASSHTLHLRRHPMAGQETAGRSKLREHRFAQTKQNGGARSMQFDQHRH